MSKLNNTCRSNQIYQDNALVLYELGYNPIPVKEKRPVTRNWSTVDVTEKQVTKWCTQYPNYSIGVRGDSAQAIDVDVLDKELSNKLVEFCKNNLEGSVLQRVGKPPKLLIPVRSKITKKMVSTKYRDADGDINQIEFLTHGQQWVAYGIHPDTRKPYEWHDGSPLDVSAEELPIMEEYFLGMLFAKFYELAIKKGWKAVTRSTQQPIDKQLPSGDEYYTPWGRYSATVDIDDVIDLFKSEGWTV